MSRDAGTSQLTETPTPAIKTGSTRLIRTVTPSDGPNIHQLFFGRSATDETDFHAWLKRWRWATVDNPFRENRPAGWIVWDNGRLVGYLAAIHVPLNIRGIKQPGVIATSLTVAELDDHDAERDIARGLISTMFDATSQCGIFVKPSSDPNNSLFEDMGCVPLMTATERWTLPATPTQVIQTAWGGRHLWLSRFFQSGSGIRFSHWIETLYRQRGRIPPIPVPADCRMEVTTAKLADDHKLFASNATTDKMITIDRNRQYLTWRYAEYPGDDLIRVIMLRDGNEEPIAGAILSVDHSRDCSVAHIEDMAIVDERRDMIHTLITAAAREACRHDAKLLVTTTGQDNWRQWYSLFGFRPRPRTEAPMLARPDTFTGDVHDLEHHIELWHGTMTI